MQDDKPVKWAAAGAKSWTHLRTFIYLDDPLKRDFYCEMCRLERWSSRQLFLARQKRITLDNRDYCIDLRIRPPPRLVMRM